MAEKRGLGSEANGRDDDEDVPSPQDERKVQIENSYFEKLKHRLGQQPGATNGPAAPEKPKGPGYVIYGDDGRPLK